MEKKILLICLLFSSILLARSILTSKAPKVQSGTLNDFFYQDDLKQWRYKDCIDWDSDNKGVLDSTCLTGKIESYTSGATKPQYTHPLSKDEVLEFHQFSYPAIVYTNTMYMLWRDSKKTWWLPLFEGKIGRYDMSTSQIVEVKEVLKNHIWIVLKNETNIDVLVGPEIAILDYRGFLINKDKKGTLKVRAYNIPVSNREFKKELGKEWEPTTDQHLLDIKFSKGKMKIKQESKTITDEQQKYIGTFKLK